MERSALRSSHPTHRGWRALALALDSLHPASLARPAPFGRRSVLRFHPRLAPIKAAVLPLVKNKPELLEKARAIYERLQRRYFVTFDVAGAIGRRYRRMDEVGTPYCITVDFDTLDDDTVTLRERDSTEQRRVTVDELLATMEEAIDG